MRGRSEMICFEVGAGVALGPTSGPGQFMQHLMTFRQMLHGRCDIYFSTGNVSTGMDRHGHLAWQARCFAYVSKERLARVVRKNVSKWSCRLYSPNSQKNHICAPACFEVSQAPAAQSVFKIEFDKHI